MAEHVDPSGLVSQMVHTVVHESVLQLDKMGVFGRPKKGGRGGNGGGSGFDRVQLPRPRSESDFGEAEDQEFIIERLDDDAVNAEFEKMLDDMNLNEDKKEPLRNQPIMTKKQMLKIHHKGSATDHRNKFDRPADYIQYLGSFNTCPDRNINKLYSCMESLRIALTNNPVSWVKEFGHKGLKQVLTILNECFRSDSQFQRVQYECIRCLKAIMNNSEGFKQVFENKEALTILARSLDVSLPNVMVEAVKLLAAVTIITPNGHEKVLEAITISGETRGRNRFQPIVQGLLVKGHPMLRVACFQLLNAIVSTPDDLDFRLHLRNEFMRVGLINILDTLENDQITGSQLKVQLNVFREQKEEDQDEFLQRFENLRFEFDDINECFEIVKNLVMDTVAEPYLLSILQHLLCIRDDALFRPAYYKLIEECVSQIVLHKSGCDPDFHSTRFHIDVEPLIENLVERSRADEDRKLEDMNKKVEEALSNKQETEAKLTQAEMRIQQLEEHLRKGGGGTDDTNTEKKNKADNKKAKKNKDKQKKKPKAGSIPPPPTSGGGNAPIPPPFPGGAYPPPPPMSGMGPPPPPMPGMGPPPPPMPGMGPPPPPMPGMGPPPPPMPGMGPPPPPMAGMGPPPPPGGIPGLGPPGFAVLSPPRQDILPYGMKPKRKWEVGVPLKRTNWNTIIPNKLKEKSFWVCVDEEKYASNDIFEGLTLKFSSKPAAKRMKEDSETKTTKKAKDLKVLDGKAAQNISILLGGSLKHISYDDVKKCILQCDETVITDNVLQQLIQYLPPPDQLKKLEEFKNQYEDLTEAEQFAVTVSEVKRLLPRLKSMSFKLHYYEMVQDVKPDIVAATAACEEVKTSKKFSKLLELILLMGNYMNSGTKKERAVGFEISYLPKLASTKDAENKMTLLHYLVETAEKKFPELLNFNEELLHVDKAARTSLENIQKTLRQMDASIRNLEMDLNNARLPQNEFDRFSEVMGPFSKEAREQCDILQNMFKRMDSLYTELSDYFVFDKQKYTLEDFFGDIKLFKDSFMQAYQDCVKLRETEEKTRRAKEAREKAERERAERAARKKALVDITVEGDQEGVMDSLLEALQTGTAFTREQRRKRAPPRAAGAERRAQLNRSRSRPGIVGTGLMSRELSYEMLGED